MSKLKLVLIILILGGLVVGGYTYLNQNLLKPAQQTTNAADFVESDGIKWYQDSINYNLAIFHKPFEVRYTQKDAQNLKEQSLINNYSLAVNGSYYRGSIVNAEHAGLLQIKGNKLFGIVTDPDAQLTQVVVYDQKLDVLSFMPVKDFPLEQYKTADYTLFQTGPLLIDQNKIQLDEINASANGKNRALRTVLGYTETGDKLLMITKVPYKLEDLVNEILKHPALKDHRINVINLDGGSSTAMYSKELSQFQFSDSKRLPVVIGVK